MSAQNNSQMACSRSRRWYAQPIVPLGNTELIPGQKSDPGRSCRIREREAPLVVANSRVVVTGRVVGYSSIIQLSRQGETLHADHGSVCFLGFRVREAKVGRTKNISFQD